MKESPEPSSEADGSMNRRNGKAHHKTGSTGHHLLDQTSLRFRMGLLNGVFALGIVSFVWLTHSALQVQLGATDEVIRLNEAEQFAQNADRMHDSLRGDLYAVLLAPQSLTDEAQGFVQRWRAEVSRFREDLQRQSQLPLPQALRDSISAARGRAEEYLVRTEELLKLASDSRIDLSSQLPAFEASFRDLGDTFESLNSSLSSEIDAAKLRASSVRDAADSQILIGAAATIVGSMLLAWTITRSVRLSIYNVSEVARSLASGQLDVRYDEAASNEIGAIGRSLNTMAGNLQGIMSKLRTDTEHDRFSKQVAEALWVTDSEEDIAQVAARAMAIIDETSPMELLLADAAQTTLSRVAESISAGSAGCLVDSPRKCVAVRRGNVMEYADSRQLNACPYLRNREFGACSAVCVPLSFMGQSMGVLHAMGPVERPLGDHQVTDLENLAMHLSNRTGTQRAFRWTENQASTDSMTGLSNRRGLEARVAEMIRSGTQFGIVMGDLDHFKKLNDSLGHLAGDRALQLFSDVVRSCMRAVDLSARWGGEEFVVILHGAGSAQAVEWTERLRRELATRCTESRSPEFTASFGVADSSMWPDFAGLLRIADAALYQSKEGGRDRVTLGTADMAIEDDAIERADVSSHSIVVRS